MSKQKQQTLFAFGVTRHVKLPSGREVEVKEKDIAGEGEIEKVGSKKCKFCDFFTDHGPALAVHVSMKHSVSADAKRPKRACKLLCATVMSKCNVHVVMRVKKVLLKLNS